MDIYTAWSDIPEHLMTRKQLNKAGLRVARGQKPVAQKTGGYGPFDLYDSREAVAKRQMSEAQKAALEKAKQQAVLNSRCARCEEWFDHIGSERIASTDTGNGAYICFMCADKKTASAWARRFLSTVGAVILDTETTGLDETAQIVEIAIIDNTGHTLVNTLVKPRCAIPESVAALHGITDSEVENSPRWDELDDWIFDILAHAPTVGIYNANYDLRLIKQSRVAVGLPPLIWDYEPDNPLPETTTQLLKKTTCVMEMYAMWYGEWSNYHKSYRWQRLNGGHRALGDCLATLELIKEMAR